MEEFRTGVLMVAAPPLPAAAAHAGARRLRRVRPRGIPQGSACRRARGAAGEGNRGRNAESANLAHRQTRYFVFGGAAQRWWGSRGRRAHHGADRRGAEPTEVTTATGADGHAHLEFDMPRLAGEDAALVIEAIAADAQRAVAISTSRKTESAGGGMTSMEATIIVNGETRAAIAGATVVDLCGNLGWMVAAWPSSAISKSCRAKNGPRRSSRRGPLRNCPVRRRRLTPVDCLVFFLAARYIFHGFQ